jgi:hypothetical protein
MSSQDTSEDLTREEENLRDADQDNDSVASKLSKELSNWRRRRTSGRSRRNDGPSSNYHSDSARTIKVRGHETLVIRKPRMPAKPSVPRDESSH